MATVAEYILNEPDFIKKVEVANYLKKKNNIYFNTQVILKAEIARQFIDYMEIDDVDRNFVLSACLMFDCLKIDSPEEVNRLEKSQEEYKDYLLSLGFDERFCKVCNEHSRVGHDPNEKREKESDILELVDQFGGMLVNRSDRLAFTVDEEIGEGPKHFNYKKFDAKYAYTIDGSDINIVEAENFNAYAANVEITGVSIHPGEAKGKLINALLCSLINQQ